ncbi:MAG: hypothetical protein SGI92_11810 [Bryobacteraceae bacterium]|nr:hypothetical protein [Bryobacteraceae bacterium]
MRKNLWLLDLLLLGLVLLVGSMLRDRWAASDSRVEALLRQNIAPAPPPTIPALAGVQPVTAAAYVETAQQLLFSRDRNPNVILDPPPPPPAPVPMPDLPVARGVIDIGTGPTIILSERAGAAEKGYRPGMTIGPFKIVALTTQEVTFEWQNKQVVRKIEQILDRTAQAQVAPQQTANTQPAAVKTLTSLAPVKAGPGQELGERSRACISGDTSAPGTVQDGYRKVVNKSPFGDVCRWEAVN